jgi:hypothetical protein
MMDLYQSTFRALTPTLNPFNFLQNAPESGARPVPNVPGEPASHQGAASGREAGELNEFRDRLAELEKLASPLAAKEASRRKGRSAKRKALKH